MGNQIKEFRLKIGSSNFLKRNIYIVDVMLFLILFLYMLYNLKSKMIVLNIVYSVVFGILFLVIIIFEMYVAFIRNNNKIADLAISKDSITIPFGIFGKPKVLYVKYIIKLYVPKYDEMIEIIYKDNSKIRINLYGYDDQNIVEIRELLTKIMVHPEKKDNNMDNQNKTYNIVNGKPYVK